MISYSPVHKILGEIIDNDSVKKLTGHGFNTWRRLTGFFDGEIIGKVINKEEPITIFGEYPSFRIECKKIDLLILVNIETGLIINSEVLLSHEDKKNGLGLIAHQNQLKIAKELGFKKILLNAYGGIDRIFNGNITWAKFGYTMTQDSHAMYEETLMQHKGERCLQKIFYKEKSQIEKKNNEQFCNEHIPRWMGEFDLRSDSINWSILNLYIHRKSYHPKN